MVIAQATPAHGSQVLQDLVKNNADKYHRLTEEQKKTLIAEFEQNKAVIAKGTHVSARSKVNDAVRTVKAIENLVSNLIITYMTVLLMLSSAQWPSLSHWN